MEDKHIVNLIYEHNALLHYVIIINNIVKLLEVSMNLISEMIHSKSGGTISATIKKITFASNKILGKNILCDSVNITYIIFYYWSLAHLTFLKLSFFLCQMSWKHRLQPVNRLLQKINTTIIVAWWIKPYTNIRIISSAIGLGNSLLIGSLG